MISRWCVGVVQQEFLISLFNQFWTKEGNLNQNSKILLPKEFLSKKKKVTETNKNKASFVALTSNKFILSTNSLFLSVNVFHSNYKFNNER